ncbi:MAG: YncE family protein [Chloroflexota bacterium]|nr:YncE family protein [Chloroflexota bacterium]
MRTVGRMAKGLVVVVCAVGLLATRTPETVNVTAREVGATTSHYLALVTNSADGTVSVIDVDSGMVIQTITVGSAQGGGSHSPGCIAISPDESLALVTYEREGSHRVIALDVTAIADGIEDNEIINDTIYLEQTEPGGGNCIDITPDGTRAYVAGGTNSADIAVIDIGAITDDIPDNEVTWVDTGNAFFESVAMTPDGSRAYVTDDGYADAVHVVATDPTSSTYNTVVAQIDLGSINTFARGIAITPDGSRAYVVDWGVQKVYVIDTNLLSATHNTIVAEIDLDPYGKRGYRIAITPDGTRAYISRAGEVAVIDTDLTSPTYNALVDTISDVPAGEGGIAITPDGEIALVVGKYNDAVSIVETASGTEVTRVPVGQYPEGIVVYRAPVPENHVKVVDEAGAPLRGALVYQNGLAIGTTDERGVIVPEDIQPGDRFVALSMIEERSTIRSGHQTPDSDQDWMYRVHITSLERDADGDPIPHTVTEPGQQIITVYPSSPLILFNVVVSIEWDADDAYVAAIARAAQFASDYLYDLTDGQMAFDRVTVYDRGTNWANADVQISTKNIVRPHAYVGGVASGDRSHVIRVGRFWDGNSGNQGPWDAPDGYRTLVHEFGHYALHLYDEYFAYVFDQYGNLIDEVPSYCTGPENRNPATEATSASVMDYQYTCTELSARGVPGMWSALCEQTAQWQLNGESAWETLARVYTDTLNPPRWRLTTPLDRGSVLAGPAGVPTGVLSLPTVVISNTGASGPPRPLTVYGPQGEPYRGAIVALYEQGGRVVGQGFTGADGRLDVYGADTGDTVRSASIDGGLDGRVTVGTELSLTMTLEPVWGLAIQAAGGIPHMRVIAEPSQNPEPIDLLVFLQSFGPGADPDVIVTEPGSEVGYAPTLDYISVTNTYEGRISFSATERGTGRIRATGGVNDSLVRLQSTYRLQHVLDGRSHDIYSDDGNLSLHLEPGSLLGSEAYFVVMPPGAAPGPLPAGLVLVGNPYDVTASGAMATLEQPGILTLHYDGALVHSSSAPEGLGIYHWDSNSETWQETGGSLDEEQKAVVAPVTVLGIYALLSPSSQPTQNVVFLPVILVQTR